MCAVHRPRRGRFLRTLDADGLVAVVNTLQMANVQNTKDTRSVKGKLKPDPSPAPAIRFLKAQRPPHKVRTDAEHLPKRPQTP